MLTIISVYFSFGSAKTQRTMDGWGLKSVLAKHVTTTTPGRETEKLLIPHRNYKLYVILFYICLILLQLAGRYDR